MMNITSSGCGCASNRHLKIAAVCDRRTHNPGLGEGYRLVSHAELVRQTKRDNDKRIANWERSLNDGIVNRFMAEVDSKIDRIVLEWRMRDAIMDGIFMPPPSDRWKGYADRRAVASRYECAHRPLDLQTMIENIRGSDSNIPAERHGDIGFGPYDGNDDKYLSLVLDYAGPDFADEEGGDVEWCEYIMRFGRVLLASDDRGFRTLDIRATEEEAHDTFEKCMEQYAAWSAAHDED